MVPPPPFLRSFEVVPPPPHFYGVSGSPSPIAVALWVLPTFSWGFGDPPLILGSTPIFERLWGPPKPISEGLPPPSPPFLWGFGVPPPITTNIWGGVFAAPPSPTQNLWGLPTPERIWGPADLFTPFPPLWGGGALTPSPKSDPPPPPSPNFRHHPQIHQGQIFQALP